MNSKTTFTLSVCEVTPRQLKAARAELWLRQVDLAPLLGVGRLEISKKEQGIRRITPQQALALRALLAAHRLRRLGWSITGVEYIFRLR